MINHGEITSDRCRRWCAVCNAEHGILYPCEYYSEATLAEIKKHTDIFVGQLCDSEWRASQIVKGTPPEVIDIMRFFAGLEE